MSYISWSRIVNMVYRDLVLVRDGGDEVFLAFPGDLSDRIDDYREALADRDGGYPIAFEMRMNPEGRAQIRVVWDDQVWFGDHPGSPFQPSADPTVPEMPTAEMWRLELAMHPRNDERVPDWWRMLLDDDAGAHRTAARDAGGEARGSGSTKDLTVTGIDEALAAPVRLPAAHRVMEGAWGWDRVYERVNDAVVRALRDLPEDARGALFGASDPDAREDSVVALADTAFASVSDELRGEWSAATPIRLVREWNERHGGRDPQGLGSVDPTASFVQEVARSLPLKHVDAQLGELIRELVDRNLRDRLFGA